MSPDVSPVCVFVVRYAVGGRMTERVFPSLDAAQRFAGNAGGYITRRQATQVAR